MALTGRKLPDEVKQKLLGRPSWSKGKKLPPLSEERKAQCRNLRHSDETKAKISAAGRRPMSEETKRKIGAANYRPHLKLRGRKRPPHVVEAMRAAHLGKPKSAEMRAKISATKRRQAAENRAAKQ